MGNSSSKVTKLTSATKTAAEAVQGTVNAAASVTRRKLQKEGQQYMASDRAHRRLEEEKQMPKRAPMNLGSANSKLSENLRAHRLAEVKQHQQEDKAFLSLMKDVYVSSTDPENMSDRNTQEHSFKRSDNLSNKLPKRKTPIPTPTTYSMGEVPRGRAEMKTIILALYNHKMNPQDWGVTELAKKVNLRESDVKNIIENFELLHSTSDFKPGLSISS